MYVQLRYQKCLDKAVTSEDLVSPLSQPSASSSKVSCHSSSPSHSVRVFSVQSVNYTSLFIVLVHELATLIVSRRVWLVLSVCLIAVFQTSRNMIF